MKKVAILGSTGSIGTQALEVATMLKNEIEVVALAGGRNVELLKKQICEFSPKIVCTQIKDDAELLSKEFSHISFVFGDDGLNFIASNPVVDLLLVAVSGKIGLKPTITAIKNKKQIALANKETLVMAGDIVMSLAKEYGVQILPVDSEHSAIFQCLQNSKKPHKLIITASGGPFKDKSIEEMDSADASSALKHPRWKMGKKITVDSATLMNKGLEVIEAHHLFDMDYNDIKVVIHPQSIIHSAVEYQDGSVIAQLGVPSMHIPIQYAITYPDRLEGIKTESFDFAQIAQLTFEEPDFDKFPALDLAFDAGKKGQGYPVVLNASNEEAVMAFLNNKIKLTDITKIVAQLLSDYQPLERLEIDDILELDEQTRVKTRKIISSIV